MQSGGRIELTDNSKSRRIRTPLQQYCGVQRAMLRHDPRHSYSGPPIFEKLWRARSRLYRSRFLRPRYHFAAFFEIYKMYIPSHRSKLNFYCKISDEILLIFSKKSTFHIKFDVFRIGFDENSSEFQQFSENCEEHSRFHSF